VVDATIASKGRFEVRGGKLRVSKGSGNKTELDIGPETQVVGRNKACDLVLDDKKVSAVHMELVATERGVRVRDLGSRNGTFVGDTRIGEVYLTKAGFIACGDSHLEFHPSNPEQVNVPDVAGFGPLAGQSPPMRSVFE
jgi:pSer/pThr/pTyr-binding forkhead associated (FHA) protein